MATRNGNTDRARGRVQARVTAPAQTAGEVTLHQRIANASSWFEAARPSQFETRLLIRDAQHALRTVKQLDEVDWPSLCGALMTATQLGLRIGVLNQSWVLPFWDSKAKHRRAQLIIGYQGYAELAHRSGMVDSIVARSVREGDEFDVDYGAEMVLHKPKLRGVPGEAYGYYAVVRLKSGGRTVWYMSREEVEAHRDRHAMARTKDGVIVGPWIDHFDAMARKTALLQLIKYIPKTPEIAAALAWDTSTREEKPGTEPTDLAAAGYVDGEVIAVSSAGQDPAKAPDDPPVQGSEGPVEPTAEDIAAMNAEAAEQQEMP